MIKQVITAIKAPERYAPVQQHKRLGETLAFNSCIMHVFIPVQCQSALLYLLYLQRCCKITHASVPTQALVQI